MRAREEDREESNGGVTTQRVAREPTPRSTTSGVSRVLFHGERQKERFVKFVKSRKTAGGGRSFFVFFRKRVHEDERRSETAQAREREALGLSGRACPTRRWVGDDSPGIRLTQKNQVWCWVDSPAGAAQIGLLFSSSFLAFLVVAVLFCAPWLMSALVYT